MPARAFHALAVAALLTAPAAAQDQLDRRSREQPEVVPRAGDGRHGSCDELRFTAAGDVLFAAGDDKVLTGWRHGEAGLDADPAKAEVLRWPAWREQLGGVKAFDLSADGKRVAVGGFGLRPSSVVILERGRLDGATKQLLTWPSAPPDAPSFGTVQAVAFSADGKTVAFGTQDGSIWLWQPEELKAADAVGRWCQPPKWVGTGIRPVAVPGKDKPQPDLPVLVFFGTTGKKLIVVAESGAVAEYAVGEPDKLGTGKDTAAAPAKALFNVSDGGKRSPVFKAVYDRPRDRLVIAPDANRVLIRTLDGKPATVLPLPANHYARSLAVHPKTGVIAVAVGSVVPAADKRPQFHNDADDVLYLYTDAVKKPVPDQLIPFRGQADALAFHPTLDRLAAAGGDASEVTLFALGDAAKPVAVARWTATRVGLLPAGFDNATRALTVVRGSGRKVWELALAADGKGLGMRTRRAATVAEPNGRGAGDWNWTDLNKLIPTATAPKGWAAAVTAADGWTVEPDPKARDTWYAVHTGGVWQALDFNAYVFNKPTCFTFLKATDTAPTRLIVGHYYGASLFELPNRPAAGTPLTPRRVFIGHAGEVLSVAAVDDAKGGWFVTGGTDHTVAAFHLAAWKNGPNLGVAFEETAAPARLVVTAVDVGSPGWEAGLLVGDEVLLLAARGQTVYDARPVRKGPAAAAGPFEADERKPTDPALNSPTDRAAALAVLARAAPAQQLYFRVRTRAGASRDLATSVKQRPLWKLYPTFTPDDAPAEWVAWMWRGSYYQTASPNGDALVGWHVNGRTANVAPRFHPLSHFRNYQRNELVRTLIRDRDVAAALDQIRRDPTRPTSRIGDSEPAPIRLAVDRTEVTGQAVTVRVTVDRRGSDVDHLPERVELWVNDYRYQVWPHDPLKPFDSEELKLDPAVFRSEDKRKTPFGDNVLTVQTYNRAGGRESATRLLTNLNPPPPPKLLGLTVGVNDYKVHRVVSGARGVVGDLKYAAADADLVTDSFAAHVGAKRHFVAGKLGVKTDAAVLRKQLLDALAALKADANPNDMLVLFLAGHGQLVGRKGATTEVIPDAVLNPEKAYDDVRFAFCCPDFDTGKPGDAVVTADELFDALAGINCRKMVLLDVCRSGWAAKTDVIRQFVPNGLGPFVLAACGPGQQSYEMDDLKHGLFTTALTEAITVGSKENAAFHIADTDKDGKLSCQELFDYVRKRVGEERNDQTPTCFPDRARLPRTVVVSTRR